MLPPMILSNVNAGDQTLTMNYCQHVVAADMAPCLHTVRELLNCLEPDFLLLTDLTGLEFMEAACGPHLGTVMDLCRAKGVREVVRVIPNPQKDIGFALIALFHHRQDLHTRTYDNLPEALQSIADHRLRARATREV